MSNLYVHIGADCEATQPAVQDADLGERAVRGLREICEREAGPGTFYVIPGDLQVSPDLYRAADKAGWEIGLHVHPKAQGFEHEFMGVYAPDEQRRILEDGIARFEEVMGRRPMTICLGYNSANDHTYPILAEMGFTHGQCCMPGRILPECASVWAGAPLGPHYVHRYNRLLVGDVDFVEMPATVDPDSRMWGGKHPQDLRVELVDAKNHWYTMDKAIQRQIAAESSPVCLRIKTHNIFDYSDPNNFRRGTLEAMLGHCKSLASDSGLDLMFVTGDRLNQSYRELHPIEDACPRELALDRRGYGRKA